MRPFEPDPKDALRIAFHTRAMADVRRKIMRSYAIDAREAEVSASLKEFITQHFHREMEENSSWMPRRRAVLKQSRVTAEALDATMDALMLDYLEAFRLRTLMKTGQASAHAHPSPDYYNEVYTKDDLSDVLINHISNRAEARLRQLGLNPADAHLVHGNLIKGISYAYSSIDCENHFVFPQQGPIFSNEDTDRSTAAFQEKVAVRREELSNYWRENAQRMGRYLPSRPAKEQSR